MSAVPTTPTGLPGHGVTGPQPAGVAGLFTYPTPPSAPGTPAPGAAVRVTELGDVRVTQSGDTRVTE